MALLLSKLNILTTLRAIISLLHASASCIPSFTLITLDGNIIDQQSIDVKFGWLLAALILMTSMAGSPTRGKEMTDFSDWVAGNE